MYGNYENKMFIQESIQNIAVLKKFPLSKYFSTIILCCVFIQYDLFIKGGCKWILIQPGTQVIDYSLLGYHDLLD